VGVPAAPRIDDRLRRYIAGARPSDSAAEVTRAAGNLAWSLGLPRPSYQQVRVLMRAGGGPAPGPPPSPSTARLVLRAIDEVLGFVYQYPGPGMADWYRRYTRGL
jgi:hypothetical protein